MTKKAEIRRSKYQAIHNWLRQTKPKKYICDACFKKCFTEYALKKGKQYRFKKNYFFELCVGCHRRYDSYARVKKQYKSRRIRTGVYSDEKLCELIKQGLSYRQIGRFARLSPTAIANIAAKHGLKKRTYFEIKRSNITDQ